MNWHLVFLLVSVTEVRKFHFSHQNSFRFPIIISDDFDLNPFLMPIILYFSFLNFQEVLDPPAIVPSSQYQLSLAFPDLGQHKVSDLFSTLGPVAIFSAKHHWTAPRTVRLKKREHEGYGFSVRGDAPVIIAGVDIGSIAEVRNY